MKNIFNPLFLYQKKEAIAKRIIEIPINFLWYKIYTLIDKGFIYHKDYEKLNATKDIHKDKIGFLMGNGPSVKISDLEEIANNQNIVTFAANRIHLTYEESSYRPTYIISSDQQVIDDFGQDIIDNNEVHKVYFASFYKPTFLKGEYTWLKLKNGRPFKFSNDIKKVVMSGGGTLNVALQLGYHMGIRKFYLYGVDHNFVFENNKDSKGYEAQGEGNHFIKNYRSGKSWQAPRNELVEETFIKLNHKLESENGYLINLTHGGKLEVLERNNLYEVLKNYEN